MRERWAQVIALLAGGLVVGFALWFAWRQNPAGTGVSPDAVPASAIAQRVPDNRGREPASSFNRAAVARGKDIYADLACARCHSVGGEGGGRSALDGVGGRLNEASIRAWLTPEDGNLGFQSRHARIDLAEGDRDALVAYLRSLR